MKPFAYFELSNYSESERIVIMWPLYHDQNTLNAKQRMSSALVMPMRVKYVCAMQQKQDCGIENDYRSVRCFFFFFLRW